MSENSEVKITVGNKTYTVAELVKVIFDNIIGGALTGGQALADTVDQTIAASRHNADLLDALDTGADFRVAFKKRGETEWTRVRFADEDNLRDKAIEEVLLRQEVTMGNLANLLDTDNLSINNI